MPRILVTSAPNSDGESAITLDEYVAPSDLEAQQHANQLIGRLGWAVHDADEVDGGRRLPRPRGSRRARRTGRLAEVAHAVREHEDTTRGAIGADRPADRRLYRRFRQAFRG